MTKARIDLTDSKGNEAWGYIVETNPIPEASRGTKAIILVILICIAILSAIGLVSIFRDCSDLLRSQKTNSLPYIAPDSEKSRMKYHGVQAAWECDGVYYFTRKPEDFNNRKKWIRL